MSEIIEFEQLPISVSLKKLCLAKGFGAMTPIQRRAIPPILEGKDVVGQSGTGSGKTLAFGLPILDKIKPGAGLQAMVLTPTRELCVQVGDVLGEFGGTKKIKVVQVYGGVSMDPQIRGLEQAEVAVGTPGRTLDHISRRTISFNRISQFVLDEADKMFEMGFAEDVERIIGYLPDQRQMLLFSATMPSSVEHMLKRHLYHPVRIEEELQVDVRLLHQRYFEVEMRDKFSLLYHLLKRHTSGLALVFCATRGEADIVAWNLAKQGIAAKAIHGGLSQNRRLRALGALREAKIDVLVATDVAARGLDIKNVTHVYNYDVPKTPDDYTHRVGRTARAGAQGDAVTLLTQRDHDNFRHVLSDCSINIKPEKLPEFSRVEFSRRISMGRSGGREFRDARSSLGIGKGRGVQGRDMSRYNKDRNVIGGSGRDERDRRGGYSAESARGVSHSEQRYRGGSDRKGYQHKDSRPMPHGRPKRGPRVSYRE